MGPRLVLKPVFTQSLFRRDGEGVSGARSREGPVGGRVFHGRTPMMRNSTITTFKET